MPAMLIAPPTFIPYEPSTPPNTALLPAVHVVFAVTPLPSLHTVPVPVCHVPLVGLLIVPLAPTQYFGVAKVPFTVKIPEPPK